MLADPAEFFVEKFGHKPEAVAFAPGRINIIGEHVDYNGGIVLPTPLDLGVTVAVSRQERGVSAASALFEDTTHRDMDEKAQHHWTDYILGAAQIAGVTSGLKIAVTSTLPDGASVSSSAALIVANLRALNEVFDLGLSGKEIAIRAQAVENNYIGLKNGLMDQMVSSCGRFGQALLFDTLSGEISDYPLIRDTAIVTLHSGQTRRLQDNAYNDRRDACDRAAADIGVEYLRNAQSADLPKVTDPSDRAKARHVIEEGARTEAALHAIETNDVAGLGHILTACHWSLSKNFDVSTAEMDELIETAIDESAYGARMIGAGFGGCMIALTSIKDADEFSARVIAKHPNAWHVATLKF